jgi:hypothetical protein
MRRIGTLVTGIVIGGGGPDSLQRRPIDSRNSFDSGGGVLYLIANFNPERPLEHEGPLEAAVKTTLAGMIIGVFVTLVASTPVVAHHGTASFDTSKDLTLKGTVTDWIWANPHCFLKFDAMDDTGAVRNWAVEVSNPTDMTKRGWARTSFKVGDVVTVNLQPVKNGAPIGRLRTVMLADGSTLSAMGPAPASAAPPAQ